MLRSIFKQQIRLFGRQRTVKSSQTDTEPEIESIQQIGQDHYNYFERMSFDNDDQVQYCTINDNILLIGYPPYSRNPEYTQEQQTDHDLAQILKIDELVDQTLDTVDLQFYQFEPSQYLYKRRSITKEILKSEMFKNQEVGSIDILQQSVVQPIQPNELRLELQLFNQQLHFQHKKSQNKEIQDDNEVLDHEVIEDFIVNKGILDEYDLLKGNLMYQIMQDYVDHQYEDQKMYLIEPPEIFTRLLLSSLVPYDELKQIFIDNLKTIREYKQNHELENQIGIMQKLTLNELGMKYFKTKDMIMTTIIENIVETCQQEQLEILENELKEIEAQNLNEEEFEQKKEETEQRVFGQQKNMVFHLKMSHYYSLQFMLELRIKQNQKQQLVDSLSWEDIFKIERNSFNETEEQLIEKQVIMDFLFESRIWNQIYVKDPFMYLDTDKMGEEDKLFLAKTFYQLYQRYQKIIDQAIK